MTIREGRLAKANTAFEAKKERLDELNSKLKGVTDKDVLSSTNRNKKENLEKVDASIQSKEKSVKNAKKHWEKLKNKRVSKKNLSQHKADVKQAQGTFYGETSALSGLQSKKQQINDQVERVNIERLKNIKDSLGRNNHTNAYNKLQQMVANLQANNSRISGRQVTWDMDEILRNAGIKDAFKEGGSINRNKINKFLNYAKG